MQVTGEAPCGRLANYFTAGGSIDHSAIGFQSSSTLAPRISRLRGRGRSHPARLRQHRAHPGQSGLCPCQPGRHHRLLRPLCGGRAGPDRRVTVTGGLAHQCREHRHPRPQRPQCRTERQPWLHAISIRWRASPTRSADGISLFGGYSQANRVPTPLETDCASADPALPAGKFAGRRSRC